VIVEIIPECIEKIFSVRESQTHIKLNIKEKNSNFVVGVSNA
jgi:ribosomal protein S19